jgi:RNA recognition motif-containing protein
MLWEAFKAFGSLADARVMKEQGSLRSRGYGFVAFRDNAVR